MTLKLVVLGGTGDVYLIAALVRAFRLQTQRDAVLVTREKFGAVASMFDIPFYCDEQLVHRGENDRRFQIEGDNHLDSPDGIFYTHPCFERSRVRVDHLTVKTDVSQADMYRMLLRLPPETPLDKPRVPAISQIPNRVLIIPDAVSWPNTQQEFYRALGPKLEHAGWNVVYNDRAWSLFELFQQCAMAEWVIGPQCGVMSILTTGSFPCRKTLATPSVDSGRAPGFLAAQTFPYAYVTKFANEDYDVEEFKISIENREEMLEAIALGSNAKRLWRHNPQALPAITVSMMPGEVLDRLAVLTVKRWRFPPRRRAAVEREYQRYLEVARLLRARPDLESLFQRLVQNHEATFTLLEKLVPETLNEGAIEEFSLDIAERHGEAIRYNRDRVDLRRSIDVACGAPVSEIKSYWNPEDNP